MAFVIPNAADAAHLDQSEPDSKDFSEILAPGFDLTGVVSGCAVTPHASAMTVTIASGQVIVGGTLATVSSGNLALGSPHATLDRYDLIAVDSAGTKSVVAGTAAANPVFPTLGGKVGLVAIRVPAAGAPAVLTSGQITDKRVIVKPWIQKAGDTMNGRMKFAAGPVADVMAFGAVGDDSTDDAPAIQAAINSLATSGGTVYFPVPPNKYKINSTITVTNNGITLVGEGVVQYIFGYAFALPVGKGVTIRWGGADNGGPMFDFYGGTVGTALISGGMKNIYIHCSASVASTVATLFGIRIRAAWKLFFENVHVAEAKTYCWELTDFPTGYSGGNNSVYNCTFINCSAFTYHNPSGGGLRTFTTTATGTGGVTLSQWYGLMVDCRNGHGIDLSSCDDLWFHGTNIGYSGGTGHAIEFRGKDSTYIKGCNTISFYGLYPGAGGIYARQGDGTQVARNIFLMGVGFGVDCVEPRPIVEGDASLTWYDNRGTFDVGYSNRMTEAWGDARGPETWKTEFLFGSSSIIPTGVAVFDSSKATYEGTGAQLRLKNNTTGIVGRNAADSADVELLRITSGNLLSLPVATTVTGALTLSSTLVGADNVTITKPTGIMTVEAISGDNNANYKATAYGSPALGPHFMGRRINNTIAAPRRTALNNVLAFFGGTGAHAATAGDTATLLTSPHALIGIGAAEDWTSTARGTYIYFQVTPVGSASIAQALTLGHQGTNPYMSTNDASAMFLWNLGATNGTRIGAGTDKIGFLGATPIVKPSSTTDLRTALINLGLYTTGGASPLNLNGGALTVGAATINADSTLADGVDLALGSSSGTMIGTAISQKLAFFGSTPIIQPTSTTDLRQALINLGLYATGGASPLNLNGGLLTATGFSVGSSTFTDGAIITAGSTNGLKIGSTTTEKLGFYGVTAVGQQTGTTDLRQALINLGLYASGGASPLDLNGGTLTATVANIGTLNATSFSLTTLTATTAVLGTNPASAGTVRLPNAAWIAGRNAANSADVNMIRVNTSNQVEVGTIKAITSSAYSATGHSTLRSHTKQTFNPTNYTPDTSLDVSSFTPTEIGHVLATLMAKVNELQDLVSTLTNDLKTAQILG